MIAFRPSGRRRGPRHPPDTSPRRRERLARPRPRRRVEGESVSSDRRGRVTGRDGHARTRGYVRPTRRRVCVSSACGRSGGCRSSEPTPWACRRPEEPHGLAIPRLVRWPALRAAAFRPERPARARQTAAGATPPAVRQRSCASCPGIRVPLPSHHAHDVSAGVPPRLETTRPVPRQGEHGGGGAKSSSASVTARGG